MHWKKCLIKLDGCHYNLKMFYTSSSSGSLSFWSVPPGTLDLKRLFHKCYSSVVCFSICIRINNIQLFSDLYQRSLEMNPLLSRFPLDGFEKWQLSNEGLPYTLGNSRGKQSGIEPRDSAPETNVQWDLQYWASQLEAKTRHWGMVRKSMFCGKAEERTWLPHAAGQTVCKQETHSAYRCKSLNVNIKS